MEQWRLTPISCEARQAKRWLSVPTIILCEARGLWLFWVIRGGIGLTRRLGADSSTRTPNERMDTLPRTRASQNRWVTTEASNLGDHLSSVRRSSCLWLQLFGVVTFLLLPKCQSNGRDLAG